MAEFNWARRSNYNLRAPYFSKHDVGELFCVRYLNASSVSFSWSPFSLSSSLVEGGLCCKVFYEKNQQPLVNVFMRDVVTRVITVEVTLKTPENTVG